MYTYTYLYFLVSTPTSMSNLQRVPEKTRLEMVIGMPNEILDGHHRSLCKGLIWKETRTLTIEDFDLTSRRAFRVSSSRERAVTEIPFLLVSQYLHICILIRIYILLCLYLYICIHIRTLIFLCLYLYKCIPIRIYIFLCLYLYICIHIRTLIFLCLYLYICIHIRTYIFLCLYLYICMYIRTYSSCVYIYIYVYIYVLISFCVYTYIYVYIYVLWHEKIHVDTKRYK